MGAPPIRYPDRVDWQLDEVDGRARARGQPRRISPALSSLIHSRRLAAVCRRPAARRARPPRRPGHTRCACAPICRSPSISICFRSASCALGPGSNEAIVALADGAALALHRARCCALASRKARTSPKAPVRAPRPADRVARRHPRRDGSELGRRSCMAKEETTKEEAQ